jgi:hypothetical protein
MILQHYSYHALLLSIAQGKRVMVERSGSLMGLNTS